MVGFRCYLKYTTAVLYKWADKMVKLLPSLLRKIFAKTRTLFMQNIFESELIFFILSLAGREQHYNKLTFIITRAIFYDAKT